MRGAVAAVQFDDFHKNSAKIIRASVFGIDTNGKVRDRFAFPSNNLVITSIDIQVSKQEYQMNMKLLKGWGKSSWWLCSI